jgi:hypothetical protein
MTRVIIEKAVGFVLAAAIAVGYAYILVLWWGN